MAPHLQTGEKQNLSAVIRRSRSRWFLAWILAAALLSGGFGSHANLQLSGIVTPALAQKPAAQSAVPVVVAAAKQGDIHVYLTGLGTVTALYTATILPQAAGRILQVPFKEGDVVKKGALLVQIDPQPYEAALLQAEGQLARDKALLAQARRDFERYDILVKQDSISWQQRDDQLYLVHQYEGTVKLDEGVVRSAKINLAYTRITAPFTGRIGLRLVDPGNVVYTPSTTGLAVLTQEQPITVIFPVPEEHLPAVLNKLKSGERMQVEAFSREQTQRIATGLLLTADNQADPTTGTIRLKAQFSNEDNALFPNQFVNARLLMETLHSVTLIPAVAVQLSPKGTFVYLAKEDHTVTLRWVKVGVYEEGTASIEEGVSPGDVVVVEGAERLKDGSRVEVTNSANQ